MGIAELPFKDVVPIDMSVYFIIPSPKTCLVHLLIFKEPSFYWDVFLLSATR